jgi:hypothetical protein
VGHSILQGFLGLRASGRHGEGLGSNRGVGMEKMGLKMIGTRVIRTKRGIQWDRSQERRPRGGWVQEKKGLKLKGTTAIRMKRGMQWDRSQIRVLTGPYFFFFYSCKLYSELNNTAEAECPNS